MQGEPTRTRILSASIRLFGEHGYDRVSVRQIASAVGIKESSIYNHFQGKDDILDSIMQSFIERDRAYWPSLDALRADLHTHSAEDLLRRFFYSYKREEYGFLLSAYRIMFMEQYRNDTFQKLFLNHFLEEQRCHQNQALQILVDAGLLLPFDTGGISLLWTRVRLIMTMQACQNTGLIKLGLDHPERLPAEDAPCPEWEVCINMALRHLPEQGRDSGGKF